MYRLGLVLFVIGLVGAMLIWSLIVSDDAGVSTIEPVLCSGNDILVRVNDSTPRSLEIIRFYCVNDDGGERSEVSNLIYMAMGLMAVVAIIGLVMALIGRARQRRTQLPQAWIQGNMVGGQPINVQSMMTQQGSHDNNSKLQEKLAQLKESYDAGLIDRFEYDSRKKLLLDNFVED